jgi:hypothetical protein
MSQPIDRLEFLKRLGRHGMLVGLGGVGAAALHGTRDPSECFNENYCSSCNVHTDCTLPQRQELDDERA